MFNADHNDTICAIATGTSRGGIGIVRVSGSNALNISKQILGFEPNPRYAHSCDFFGANGIPIDNGIAIFFEGPNSFTGEDILELQGHGGIQVLTEVLERVISLNARLANPGEFTERSFLNGKIDLTQAEAIADLIAANSQQQVRSATRTLRGEFSARIKELQDKLTAIRINVEATIDFSDEDIGIITGSNLKATLTNAIEDLDRIFIEVKQGIILKEGTQAAIVGKPNVGKSSLLNALAGEDSAIVTDIPGTTRDVLKAQIMVGGIPIHLSDTAGIRPSSDPVEKEGIIRAKNTIENTDHILLIIDSVSLRKDTDGWVQRLKKSIDELSLVPARLENLTIILNKIDLIEEHESGDSSVLIGKKNIPIISLSVKTADGMQALRVHLKNISGYQPLEGGDYSARKRHLIALEETREHIIDADLRVCEHSHLELIAEDLRLAHRALGEITGEFSSDDLLGEIFSSFCVGK